MCCGGFIMKEISKTLGVFRLRRVILFLIDSAAAAICSYIIVYFLRTSLFGFSYSEFNWVLL